jgi:hypothetical protein
MTKLVVVDRSGAEHQIEGSDGLMVMELLRDINFWRSAADVVPARLATSISIRRSKQRCRRSIPMKTICWTAQVTGPRPPGYRASCHSALRSMD